MFERKETKMYAIMTSKFPLSEPRKTKWIRLIIVTDFCIDLWTCSTTYHVCTSEGTVSTDIKTFLTLCCTVLYCTVQCHCHEMKIILSEKKKELIIFQNNFTQKNFDTKKKTFVLQWIVILNSSCRTISTLIPSFFNHFTSFLCFLMSRTYYFILID